MGRYVGKRLLQVVPTIACFLLIAFLLVHLSPGDPVLALAGEHGDQAYYEFMRSKFGLDKPLHEQLFVYVGNVFRGDLGVSFIRGRPVSDVIGEHVGATYLLTVSAMLFSTVAGLALGVLAASRPGGLRDLAVSGMTLGFYATPVFWIGQLALFTLALRAGVLPVQGMTSPGGSPSGFAGVIDVGRHLLLPAVVLGLQEVAAVARLTRIGMIEELESDYVRTARAKGLPELVVIGKHGLRRTLLPVMTVVGHRTGHLLAGAVVVEAVFGWPGIGRLLLSAMQTGDSPVLLGIFLLVAFSVVAANLVTDLAYGLLDPRVAYV